MIALELLEIRIIQIVWSIKNEWRIHESGSRSKILVPILHSRTDF